MMKRFLAAILLVFSLLIVAAPPAAAFDPFSNSDPSIGGVDCSGDAANSAVCQDKGNGDPITGDNGALLKIANIVAYIGGVAAIIIIIISAIRYITSGGDSENVSGAKRTLIGAIIGLAIIVLAKSLITYVVSKV
ncbi:MAG TPA: TrbC/VirB2 family protein [Candidatus Saccharimonadales bacterium]|nr:TrbC/VirB2 family protein [Candidatus Saccharimonadales bacterium]